MKKSETLTKLAPALVKAQETMAGAKKGADNPFFKSKYANLEEVIRVVKDAFQKNGLAFVQFPVSAEGMAGVETIIMHDSGEFISNEFLLKCSKYDPQGMGSAITYARRYGLQSAAGIPSEDDDGNAASEPATKPLKKAKPVAAVVPEMTPEQAIAAIDSAKTMKALQVTFTSLPAGVKAHPKVIAAKDTAKHDFENAE